MQALIKQLPIIYPGFSEVRLSHCRLGWAFRDSEIRPVILQGAVILKVPTEKYEKKKLWFDFDFMLIPNPQ